MKDALWVGPLAVFVGVGTFFASGGHESFTAGDAVAMVLAVAACLVLLLRRSAPTLSLFLVGLAIGTYLACGFADGPVYLPLLVGSFVVALVVPVRRWLPWFAVAVGITLTGLWIRAAGDGSGWLEPLGRSTVLAALASTAAALGATVRSRQQTERERAARVSTEEQLRMAQDLHDGVGHGLAVIAMQAGVALHVLDKDPASARTALEAIRDTSRESLEALRAELSRLSGEAPRTPRRGLDDLEPLAGRVRAAGLAVSVTGADHEVPDAVAQTAYLVVQEALTNVLRHARAESVDVGVVVTGRLATVRVVDDGTASGPHDEGMGISGMRTRVEALGGSLVAQPQASGGFEVVAELPL